MKKRMFIMEENCQSTLLPRDCSLRHFGSDCVPRINKRIVLAHIVMRNSFPL